MIRIKFADHWDRHLDPSQPIMTESNIKKLLQLFDAYDYFYSFFKMLAPAGVSPFIATHDYVIKVTGCDSSAHCEMNVSPIYHLGLEYPDNYRASHGKDLDEEAIIGLVSKPLPGTFSPEQSSYAFGVDAGILFSDTNIPHNKTMTLCIQPIKRGVMINLSCENQTSSRAFSWDESGIPALEHSLSESQPA